MSLFKGVAALLSAEVPDWVYMRSLASRRDDAVAVGRAKISPSLTYPVNIIKGDRSSKFTPDIIVRLFRRANPTVIFDSESKSSEKSPVPQPQHVIPTRSEGPQRNLFNDFKFHPVEKFQANTDVCTR